MQTLVCIVGPTAVGKSALALALAQRWGTEIVSADSRQVYQQLNIGTNKPSPAALAAVPHHLVDFLPPDAPYNAGRYAVDAERVLTALFPRHQTVVLAGGTGLYLQALEHGFDALPPVDASLRNALEKEYQEGGLAPLLAELAQADPLAYQRIDRHNPQRVRRALEVIRATGTPFSSFHQSGEPRKLPFRLLKIGLTLPREALYARINQRVDSMLQQGLVAEVAGLLQEGYSPSLNSLQTIGYKEVIMHLQGKYNLQQAKALIQQHTRNYAKRQLTWFKRDEALYWLAAGSTDLPQQVEQLLLGHP